MGERVAQQVPDDLPKLIAVDEGHQGGPLVFDFDALRANPKTEVSTRISKILKKKGWSFVGPTTVYAFMQAMGMVNDHLEGCACRAGVEEARAAFARPG